MSVPDGFRARCLVGALALLGAALTLTPAASGWVRPSDFAISSPSGGVFKVCRDGIRFQVVTSNSSDDPGTVPTDPFAFASFTVYSPSPVLDENGNLVGGRIIVQGTVTLRLQAIPFDASDPGSSGSLWWYVGTHTERWPGGQRLAPAPRALLLWAGGDTFSYFPPEGTAPYQVQDCLLFGHRHRARRQCIRMRAEQGRKAFRERYGAGPHKRHAMRRCVRQRSRG
jgi:hypothetical protein